MTNKKPKDMTKKELLTYVQGLQNTIDNLDLKLDHEREMRKLGSGLLDECRQELNIHNHYMKLTEKLMDP